MTVNDPGVHLDHLPEAFTRDHRGRTVKAKQLPSGMRVYGMQQSSGPDTLTIEGSLPKALRGDNLKPVAPGEAKDYLLNDVIPSVVGRTIPPEHVRMGNTETDTDFSLDMAQIGDVLDAMAWSEVRDMRGNVERKAFLHEDRHTHTSIVRRKGTLQVVAYDKEYESGVANLDRPLRVEATHRRDRMSRQGVPTLAKWNYDTIAALHADAVHWAGFTADFVSEEHWYPRVRAWGLEHLSAAEWRSVQEWIMATAHGDGPRLSRNSADKARRHVARMGIVLSKTDYDFKLDLMEGRLLTRGLHKPLLYRPDTALSVELRGLMAG